MENVLFRNLISYLLIAVDEGIIVIDILNRDISDSEPVPVSIYQFRVNNRNTRKRSEVCSKSTLKTQEKRH